MTGARRAAVAVTALALFAAAAAAQNRVPGNGTDILRGLLKYNGFQPVTEVGRNAGRTLVVIVGSNFPPDLPPTLRQRVLRDGGALLVVTDWPMDVSDLLPGGRNGDCSVPAVAVRGGIPANCFNGDPASPLAALTEDDPTGLARVKGLAKGVVTLATLNPRCVQNQRPRDNSFLSVKIATFAAGAHFGRNPDADASEAALALMSDPEDRRGTALAFADRAMFTNGFMTAKTDAGARTDNFVYAYLLTKYLADRVKGDGRGPRECLFIEAGRPNTAFDAVSFAEGKVPPGGVPPVPPIPPALMADLLLDKANEFVAKVEDKDFPNVAQDEDRDPYNRVRGLWLLALAVIGSVVLARYLLARGWGLRQVSDQAPRVRIDPERGGGLIPGRRLGLLQSGNLYEPLRDHLRFVFGQWGVTAFDRPAPPPIALDRKTRPRQRITADLDRLWEIAAAPRRTTITPDDLEDLEEMIADLASAHQKGIWRFAPPGGTA